MIHERWSTGRITGEAVRVPFTCPECKRTSHNPNDERYRYCGACHEFFPLEETNEPAEVAAIAQLLVEARANLATGVVEDLPPEHARHWRSVIAWLQAHLPPDHTAVMYELPCHQCVDLGVFQLPDDPDTWRPCSCVIGQFLADTSA